MTLKAQKIISASLVSAATLGGFEALVYILNLNQPVIFLYLAFGIYFYLALKITLLYDLHFKNPGALARATARHESVNHWLYRSIRIVATAFWDRFRHMRRWESFRQWLNYLLLPGLIFWSTVCLFYLNFGRQSIQQVFVCLSAAALVVSYWYLKEVFQRKNEVVDNDVFVVMSAAKVYAAFLIFTAALGISRHFCLPEHLFLLGVFGLTFSLIYQALFQHQRINLKNLGLNLVLSFLLCLVAHLVFVYWGLNYFTGGIFLTAWYNFFWNLFHHKLDHNFSWSYFFSIWLRPPSRI